MKRLAVIIGRFQVAELHAGHRHLIETAQRDADSVLILLGSTQALPSARNPLPVHIRKAMLQIGFPDIFIEELLDHPSDRVWSDGIDRLVAKRFPDHVASLYGSRDSFIPSYTGKLSCVLVPPADAPSGTDLRNGVGASRNGNADFRAGLIHAQSLRPALSYQAVDIAVIRHHSQEVLLGKKHIDGGKLRFIGGFADPSDRSLESAALRELHEEAGRVDCHQIDYLGSFRIPDYRYRGEADQIMTALFAGYHLSGLAKAGDDLDEVVWVGIDDIVSCIVQNHMPLALRLISFINRKDQKGAKS